MTAESFAEHLLNDFLFIFDNNIGVLLGGHSVVSSWNKNSTRWWK
jgi:hypothetical protein